MQDSFQFIFEYSNCYGSTLDYQFKSGMTRTIKPEDAYSWAKRQSIDLDMAVTVFFVLPDLCGPVPDKTFYRGKDF